MEDLAELLFAVASIDRLILFSTIDKERLRLTQLASKLSASTQETSRHLSRLQEARIIEKESDGCFIPTLLGRALIALLPSLKFLTKHREYFLSHDLSALPLEFLERIGELEEAEFAHGVGTVLSHTGQVFREAKRYVWLASDNVMDLSTLGAKAGSEDVQLRIIVPTGTIGEAPPLNSELRSKVEVRLVEKVHAGLALNEKTAGVTFPDLAGKIDFNSGFASGDPKFRKWCTDLFMFHWNIAKAL
jgi:predicted transcriptional regulator